MDSFDRTFEIPRRAKKIGAAAIVVAVIVAILAFAARAAVVAWIAMLILGALGYAVGYFPVFGITFGALWAVSLVLGR